MPEEKKERRGLYMKKYSNYRVDIVPGVVIALISLLYISMIPGIQSFTGMGSTPLTNHFVPYLWGFSMLILGLWVAVRGFRKRAAFIKAGGKIEKFDLGKAVNEKLEVIASFAALTVYVALMNTVGFVPMTIIYLFVQILILTPKHDWKKTYVPALIVGIVCSILLYYVFRYHLNVLLPQGILKGFGL